MRQIEDVVNRDDVFVQTLIEHDHHENAQIDRKGLRAAFYACDLPIK